MIVMLKPDVPNVGVKLGTRGVDPKAGVVNCTLLDSIDADELS
jgi:hypothetical protein